MNYVINYVIKSVTNYLGNGLDDGESFPRLRRSLDLEKRKMQISDSINDSIRLRVEELQQILGLLLQVVRVGHVAVDPNGRLLLHAAVEDGRQIACN